MHMYVYISQGPGAQCPFALPQVWMKDMLTIAEQTNVTHNLIIMHRFIEPKCYEMLICACVCTASLSPMF